MLVSSRGATLLVAGVYILSGVSQPLLMTLCKHAGLADSTAQLYMFFYYLGPATLVLTLWQDSYQEKPSCRAFLKASCISLWDLVAQAFNYTGASMAGSTIFAVIYSSITIWTALWSRMLLGRLLTPQQWIAIVIVMGGLALTALESSELGPHVKHGAVMVFFGSSMHGGSYVFSEAIMNPEFEHKLSVRQNAAVQASVATLVLGFWQIVYTLPNREELLESPMDEAGTSLSWALVLLGTFALANLVHQWSFYHTLKHYPGGATSAGMMKGLQAGLVMVASDLFFCGRFGGKEMCFSPLKSVSLVSVVMGVSLFGMALETTEAVAELKGYSEIASIHKESRVDSALTVSTIDSNDSVDQNHYRYS